MPGEQILMIMMRLPASAVRTHAKSGLLMQHGFVEAGQRTIRLLSQMECGAGTDGFEGGESTRSNSSEQFDLQHLRREALARADLPSTALLALRVQTQSDSHSPPRMARRRRDCELVRRYVAPRHANMCAAR